MIRKGEPIRKWVFPLGFIKWKPQDGLYFLQLMKWGVLQYCVLRPAYVFPVRAILQGFLTDTSTFIGQRFSPSCSTMSVCTVNPLGLLLGDMYTCVPRNQSLVTHQRNILQLQITAIVSLSVTIAMYCLLSMYISVSSELSDKRPVLKLISIKAVGALLSVDDSPSLS